MKKKKLINLLLAIWLCFPILTFAETVVLESGKIVEGKLIEKTAEYIKIDFYGVPVTYFFDEIESIDGNKISVAPVEKEINKNMLGNIEAGWYINDDFRFRIKKILGWEFKEGKSIEEGVSMLSLSFQKLSLDGNFRNTLIFTISKINGLDNPLRQGPLAKGAEFISFADVVIDSATKNFKKVSFTKETILIGNVRVREARFEYADKNNNFTNRLMFFEPVEIKSDIISISVLFKCKSEEYSSIEPVLDKALMSIKFDR